MVTMTRTAAIALTTTALAGAALGQPAQRVTGPVATYWMSAETTSGFGVGMGRPGAGMSLGQMMGAGRGGHQHALTLQLGSASRPTGQPAAEHLPPPALNAGASLPLESPRQAAPTGEPPTSLPRDFQRPRGRMLIFWGCGEHAPAGQPVVIDFAQLAAGGAGAALGRGLSLTPMQPPSPARAATYGEWPNERTRTSVPPNGSLVGAHVVRGNYTPEIRFDLGADQDFLAPLVLTTNAKTAAGAVDLAWNAVPNAQAYFAIAMGGRDDTAVLWSSSAVEMQAFGLPDYISPADIRRLTASGALMGPQTTRCTTPKEVVDAAPSAMIQLAAYGPEANFSYPPRPANRATPWNIEWTAKVRHRASVGGFLGTSLGDDGGAGADDASPAARREPPPPPRAPRARDVLRGLGFPRLP